MNLLVMGWRDVKVFGMFLTSDQARPNETVIHYQDNTADKGGWIVYERGTNRLTITNPVNSQLEQVLIGFGQMAHRVENHFGMVQQVELAFTNGKVEVFQSRDMNLGDPSSVPRFSHYKTFSTDLKADGLGYYHLPVLVLDRLENVNDSFRFSDDVGRERAISLYKREVQEFLAANKDYILFIKDGELFMGREPEHYYDELNAIARNAKVVFRGANQNAIRHTDWENVETGGISIWISEFDLIGSQFIHNHIVGSTARFKAHQYSFSVGEPKESEPNVSRLPWEENIVQTGDKIHVLANVDGTFVWKD